MFCNEETNYCCRHIRRCTPLLFFNICIGILLVISQILEYSVWYKQYTSILLVISQILKHSVRYKYSINCNCLILASPRSFICINVYTTGQYTIIYLLISFLPQLWITQYACRFLLKQTYVLELIIMVNLIIQLSTRCRTVNIW